MKKAGINLFFTLILILMNINASNADINYPKGPDWALYDEHGNEWIMPPKPNQVLYDKQGKKVQPPPKPDINLTPEQMDDLLNKHNH